MIHLCVYFTRLDFDLNFLSFVNSTEQKFNLIFYFEIYEQSLCSQFSKVWGKELY